MTIAFKIRRVTALAATALAVGVGAFAAIPAHAQTPAPALAAHVAADSTTIPAVEPADNDTTTPPDALSQCDAHSLCMWQNSGYSGTFWERTNGTVPSDSWLFVGNANNGTPFNDKASSLDNNRAFASGVDKNYPANNPAVECLSGGVKVRNLANHTWPGGGTANDSISSYLLSSSANSCLAP